MNGKNPIDLAPSIPLIGQGAPAAPKVEAKFKTGDIVELVSGSPHMTVAQDTGDGRVECCYYESSKGAFQASVLFHDMVKLIAPEKTPA